MSILQMNAVPSVRLSGAWVDLAEAITWAQTRNIAVTKEARRVDPVEAGVSLVLSDADVLMSQDDAEEALLEALRHGDVAAKGRRGSMRSVPDGSAFEAISDAEWCSLCFGHAGRFRIARSEPGSAGLEIWHDLLFEARSLAGWLPAPRLFGSLAVALADRMPAPAPQIEHIPARDGASAQPAASQALPYEPNTIEHESELGKPSEPPRRRRGAPSLTDADGEPLARMHQLLESREALSVTQAANIANAELKVAGLGSEESKIRRLCRRYAKQYLAAEPSE